MVDDKTRVLIVDDHAVVLEGIKKLLSNEADFEVVGVTEDAREAISMVKSLNPDIVILDISMPHMDGLEVAHEIKTVEKNIGILVYSMSVSKAHVTALFREGVCGYVLKHEPLSELILALKVVKEGATFYSKSVRDVLQDHIKELELGEGKDVSEVKDGIAKLSVREKEVFVLLADGLIPKEISKRLGISHKTVETHKYNIMDKLKVSSIAQLTKIAIHKDLIEI
jgi:DNA-binding NarL/FixJ family response regulator